MRQGNATRQAVDFAVHENAGHYWVSPLTDKAARWLDENLYPGRDNSWAFALEGDEVFDAVSDAMQRAGLSVAVFLPNPPHGKTKKAQRLRAAFAEIAKRGRPKAAKRRKT